MQPGFFEGSFVQCLQFKAVFVALSLSVTIGTSSSAQDLSERSSGPGWAAVIGPGDHLAVRFSDYRQTTQEAYEWAALRGEYIVDETGAVSLPLVGSVGVKGRTATEAADLFADRLQQVVGLRSEPTASVQIVRMGPFYVVGAVETPGEYSFRPNLTVLNAVSLAGGLRRVPEGSFTRFERDAITGRGEMRAIVIAIDGLLARSARLRSLIAGAETITFPAELEDRLDEANVATVLKEERLIFNSQIKTTSMRVATLENLIALLRDQIGSLEEQKASRQEQIDLAEADVVSSQSLVARGLQSERSQRELQRTVAEYESRLTDIERSIIEAQVGIADAESKIVDVRSHITDEAARELRGASQEIDRLTEEFDTARRLVQEAEITGPMMFADMQGALYERTPIYAIIRSVDGELKEIPAAEFTALKPGDTLRVVVEAPDVGGPSVRQPTGDNGPS